MIGSARWRQFLLRSGRYNDLPLTSWQGCEGIVRKLYHGARTICTLHNSLNTIMSDQDQSKHVPFSNEPVGSKKKDDDDEMYKGAFPAA